MLEISQLTYYYPHQKEPTLKQLNLTIQKGDFCIILGSNGSGKSTLFKLLNGTISPKRGCIKLDDQDICDGASLVTTVVQDLSQGCVSHMTMLENLTLCYLNSHCPPTLKRYHSVSDSIQHIVQEQNPKLLSYLHMPLNRLSGGQKQQVVMMMAFLQNPKLLLLDEPTSALDPLMHQQVMVSVAKEVKAQKLTTIMVTHQLSDAIQYGNRLVLLHEGNIIMDLSELEKKRLGMSGLLKILHTVQTSQMLHE